ncbi:polysaccharide biosynthesis protein [Pontivivens ytuae]|uniref:Polysaccharide biosynthesis protein n=1 Tax=Pontivivens ytuae TaxID=2789856 RepID=A0A7S9LNX8_9RHOB|nr:nucleoside-diphosphate sugar epimerase/dehydratase [Pontivivens ytuae]QPH52594.1 polysaccharide biosynthesis protein [Pontivivens ytuae]
MFDTVSVSLAVYLAFWLRLLDPMLGRYGGTFQATVVFATILYFVAAHFLKLGRGLWRHLSSRDVNRLIVAASAISLGLIVLSFVLGRAYPLPRSIVVIYWFIQLAFFVGMRFAYRHYALWRSGHRRSTVELPPVLILGDGMAAESFVRQIFDGQAAFHPVGILSRSARNSGHSIFDVPVLGQIDALDDVLQGLRRVGVHPTRLIVTGERAVERLRARDGELLKVARAHRIPIARVADRPLALGAPESDRVSIVPVQVEDLLFRDVSGLLGPDDLELLRGRRVLVTGGGGSIGSELCRQIAAVGPARLTILDMSELNLYAAEMDVRARMAGGELHTVYADVRDRARIHRIIAQEHPDFVFHAAAMKHVPIVEADPGEGVRTNVAGTRNVADASVASGVRGFVLISTDKAVNPTNFMGCTKRVAEMYCQALDDAGRGRQGATRFVAVRFGNVLGSSGSVVPLFKKQIEAGGPVTVTHPDMTRFFMTIPEAVSLVLEAFRYGYRADPAARASLFVLDMGKPVKIIELARQMIRLAGLEPDVDIPIVISGPRPGEKLEEELFYDGEALTRLNDRDIFIAEPETLRLSDLRPRLDRLEADVLAGNAEAVVDGICTLVSGYHAPEILSAE